MEGIKSKTNSTESKKNERKEFLKKFFNRHLVFALYALLAVVPLKEIQAQDTRRKVETVTVRASQDSLELDRKNAFKNFYALVETEGIKEKVTKLKEIFGPAISGFLSLHWIDTDLNSLARLKDEEKQTNENIFVEKNNPMVMTPGSIVADAYEKRWKHNELPNRSSSLKNIDAIPGLSSQNLQEFLDNTFPKNYIAGSISQIEFIGQSDVRGNREVLGQAESFGFGTLIKSQSEDLRTSLKINLPTTGIDGKSFVYVLRHEIGHPNDWNNSCVLTSAERVSMLDEVYLRSVSKDRYISEYVEGITLEKLGLYFKGKIEDDKTKGQYLACIRVNEYWAEIQKAYFLDQSKFKKEHPADYAIVKKWIEVISK
jgi:hypothetical protein